MAGGAQPPSPQTPTSTRLQVQAPTASPPMGGKAGGISSGAPAASNMPEYASPYYNSSLQAQSVMSSLTGTPAPMEQRLQVQPPMASPGLAAMDSTYADFLRQRDYPAQAPMAPQTPASNNLPPQYAQYSQQLMAAPPMGGKGGGISSGAPTGGMQQFAQMMEQQFAQMMEQRPQASMAPQGQMGQRLQMPQQGQGWGENSRMPMSPDQRRMMMLTAGQQGWGGNSRMPMSPDQRRMTAMAGRQGWGENPRMPMVGERRWGENLGMSMSGARPYGYAGGGSVNSAQQLQQHGRGPDSMLLHVSPGEVNSLRGLAQRFGGDLTTNPHTGLPEAGFLSKILPTLLGIGLNFLLPGVGAAVGGALGVGSAAGTGLLVGAGTTAVTGDLSKGLMAGLGAFGGASLGGALGAGKEAASVGAESLVGDGVSNAGSNMLANAAGSATSPTMGLGAESLVGNGVSNAGSNIFPAATAGSAATPTMDLGMGSLVGNGVSNAGSSFGANLAAAGAPGGGAGAQGFLGKFGDAAQEGFKPGSMLHKAAPYAAGLGLINTVSEATAPKLKGPEEEEPWVYEGPYKPQPRNLRPRVSGNGEIDYFEPSNPYPGYLTAEGKMPHGFAEGGSTAAPSDTSKMTHAELVSTGWTDPANGVQQQLTKDPLSYGIVPGSQSTLGGNQFQVTKDGTWEYVPPPPPPPATPATPATPAGPADPPFALTPPAGPSPAGPLPAGGGIDPPVGPPPQVTLPPRPSGFGLEELGNPYVPKFQQRPDYVTPKRPENTIGRIALAGIPQLTERYNNSPGPITAPMAYPGGSPSERIRALAQQMAKNAAASGETDYGFAKTAPNPDGSTTAPAGPLPGSMGYGSPYYAKGGAVNMADGSFVVDARTVSEIGNGSSNAGIEILQRLGGQAVRGPGDGASDSVPASIGGKQEARVARDEVIFSPQAVKRMGGSKRLYALMNKAHSARKRAKRGTDSNVMQGLGALG